MLFLGIQAAANSSNTRESQVSRLDASVLTVAILMRILHRLLLLDPMYEAWQSGMKTYGSSVITASEGFSRDGGAPPGIVLLCIDTPTLTHKLLECTLRIAELNALQKVEDTTLQTLSENMLLFVVGLITTHDDGLDILKQYGQFKEWIYCFCVKNPNAFVRQGTCRRLFEGCANILCVIADPTISQDKKWSRWLLFDYLFHTIVSITPEIRHLNFSSSFLPIARYVKNYKIINYNYFRTLHQYFMTT